MMDKIIKGKEPQVIGAILSLLVGIATAFIIETYVEEPIERTGLAHFTIPISIAFGLLSNIVILLNFDLLQRIPSIEKVIQKVDRQHDIATQLFQSLKSEDRKLQQIYTHLQSLDLTLKEFGDKLIKTYLAGFVLERRGILLQGEHWALQTYIKFWEYLANLQLHYQNNPEEKNIIARITHSNDINIWRKQDQAYQRYAEDAYMFQKLFISRGGIIVRILIGPTDTPSSEYVDVINNMNKIGIETKYISRTEVAERDFDFMYLADQGIVLKWFSGNSGRRLAQCMIVDHVEDDVKRTWANLFELLKEKNNPITSIPDDRQHSI